MIENLRVDFVPHIFNTSETIDSVIKMKNPTASKINVELLKDEYFLRYGGFIEPGMWVNIPVIK